MDVIHSLAFTLQLAIMIFFPIGLAIAFRRRLRTAWRIFFIGAGYYLLNLVVQIPLIGLVWTPLFKERPWILLALTTLTYAVCEEVMRYLSFRAGKKMRSNRDVNGALMAGAGHGGTESIFFAIRSAWLVVLALLAPQAFKANGGNPADLLNGPLAYFGWIALSRVLAITCHLGFATLIVLAYRRGWWFFPLVILLHFLVDFSTFGVGVLTNSDLLTVLFFAFWATLSLAGLIYVRRSGIAAPQQEVSTPGESRPVTA